MRDLFLVSYRDEIELTFAVAAAEGDVRFFA